MSGCARSGAAVAALLLRRFGRRESRASSEARTNLHLNRPLRASARAAGGRSPTLRPRRKSATCHSFFSRGYSKAKNRAILFRLPARDDRRAGEKPSFFQPTKRALSQPQYRGGTQRASSLDRARNLLPDRQSTSRRRHIARADRRVIRASIPRPAGRKFGVAVRTSGGGRRHPSQARTTAAGAELRTRGNVRAFTAKRQRVINNRQQIRWHSFGNRTEAVRAQRPDFFAGREQTFAMPMRDDRASPRPRHRETTTSAAYRLGRDLHACRLPKGDSRMTSERS